MNTKKLSYPKLKTIKDKKFKQLLDTIQLSSYNQQHGIIDQNIRWINEDIELTICSPKVFSKFQGIHEQVHEHFKTINQSFPFTYIIENEHICNKEKYLAVNFVISGPTEELIRFNIRSRGGNSFWTSRTRIKVVHMMGVSHDPAVNKAVWEENKIHRDIIQVNVIDSYDNLTLKTLSLLHWTKYNCKNVDWIIKSDTDVLVNVFLMPK